MFGKTIFWLHLASGVCVGVVVLAMSVTGVILTYERQMIHWADHAEHTLPAGATRMKLDKLRARAGEQAGISPTHMIIPADPEAFVTVREGRRKTVVIDPYSGQAMAPKNTGLSDFFTVVKRWHRWFNVGGEQRDSARAITGVSNLVFLFLIVTGMYLWLPRVFKWRLFKTRLWFNGARNRAARDFNWHHVFGFWAAIPLAVVVVTATVFSWGWANALVYRTIGEEPPSRGLRNNGSRPAESFTDSVKRLSLETLFHRAVAEFESRQSGAWNTVTVNLPTPGERKMRFTVDQGNGGQPQKRHDLTLDTTSGELVSWQPFSSLPRGQQLRRWIRFIHTGEALGVAGQTLVGLASLAAVFMVWTGLALASRRFMRFQARRRRLRQELTGSSQTF